MSRFSLEYKITLLCGLCSLLFCLLLGIEWWYGQQYRTQVVTGIFTVKKGSFDMPPIPTYPFSQVPIDTYADFVTRPVFFEGRKPVTKFVEPVMPVAAVTDTPKTPIGEFGLILTGIVNTPKGGIKALFQNPNAKTPAEKNKRLAQGDVFNGWTLIDIQTDKVSIKSELETKELLLLKAKPKMGVIGGNINPFAPPNMNTAPPPVPAPIVNPFNVKH